MPQGSNNLNDTPHNDAQNAAKSVAAYNQSMFGENVFYTLFKKSERIATAIYMVSNFIPKDDTLRTDVRKCGLTITKKLNACLSCDSYDQQFLLEEVLVRIEYTVTLLSIARTAGYVSEMNTNILEKSLHDLGVHVYRYLQIALRYEQGFSADIAPVLDKDALLGFLQDTVHVDDAMDDESFQDMIQDALQNKTTFKTTINDNIIKRHSKRQVNIKKPVTANAQERRIKIQEIIKTKGEATIKDIATRITGCSEKTLQRDLAQLINDNIIEKEGEKRWSVYRIKDNN